MLAAIDAADNLPDSVARYAPTKNLRFDLIEKNADVLDCFVLLKGYIADAYTGEKAKTMIDAAGQQFYKKAAVKVWTSTSSLLSAALPFMVANLADLTANDNMPPAFHTRFKEAKATFDSALAKWKTSDTASYGLTDEKIAANNAIYAQLTAMLSDAQKVFRNDDLLKSQFTVAFLLSQTRGTKAAGVSGKVLIANTKTTIEGAQITIVELEKSVVTDAKGHYELSPVASGVYTLRIEIEGYDTLSIENHLVEIGTISRLNIELQPIVVHKITA